MPVRFTVRDDGIEPPQVAVPGFLALELIIRNDTSRPIVARLDATEPLTVNPGRRRGPGSRAAGPGAIRSTSATPARRCSSPASNPDPSL